MTALIIPNMTTFGSMTNVAISRLQGLNATIPRLGQAVATASSGYDGVNGTQFEAPVIETGMTTGPVIQNNFGVQADPKNPGDQGQAYAYAIGQLLQQWNTFWAAAEQYIDQLDNGAVPM